MRDSVTVSRKKTGLSNMTNPSLVSPNTPTLASPIRSFTPEINTSVIQTVPEVSSQTQSTGERVLEPEALKRSPLGHDISRIELRPQAKLNVSHPGDMYEQEADMMANRVMSMSLPALQRETMLEEEEEVQMKPLKEAIARRVQREPMPEEEEEVQAKPLNASIQRDILPEEESVQTKPSLQCTTDGSLQDGGNIESRLNSSKGGGSPLGDEVRGFMEPRFGHDFSQVRVHTGGDAVQMNRELGAQAFAHGSDIYFGAGKLPGNNELTAHELTHVVQQSGADVVRVGQNNEKRDLSPISSISFSSGLQRFGLEDVDVIGGIFEWLAKTNFSVPLCKELIDHYCHGQGAELGLTPRAMIQCNALIDFGDSNKSPQFLRFVNQISAEIARNANGDPTRLKDSIESDVSFSTLGGCNTSGTLGTFTVNAFGKLKVWNPNEDGTDADWLFDGNMWWYDLWDFDKKAPTAKGQPGRTEKGESRTAAGRLLVGVPFHIKTASVPVHQVRADAKGGNHYAKWEGNPDGKTLPVVSGIL